MEGQAKSAAYLTSTCHPLIKLYVRIHRRLETEGRGSDMAGLPNRHPQWRISLFRYLCQANRRAQADLLIRVVVVIDATVVTAS